MAAGRADAGRCGREQSVKTASVPHEPDGAFAIRWFSPLTEVAFCGHATLASAHVIARRPLASFPIIVRAVAAGDLFVARCVDSTGFEMSFPIAARSHWMRCRTLSCKGYRSPPLHVLRNEQAYIAVCPGEGQVCEVVPDLEWRKTLAPLNIVVAASGLQHAFVSRYFLPANGGAEDPVTHSIHAELAP